MEGRAERFAAGHLIGPYEKEPLQEPPGDFRPRPPPPKSSSLGFAGAPPLDQMQPSAPAIPSTPGPALAATGQTPEGWGWYLAEDMPDGSGKFGDTMWVGTAGGPTLVGYNGRRGLVRCAGGAYDVFCALLAVTEVDHFKRAFRGSDAHTLPVITGATGRPRGSVSKELERASGIKKKARELREEQMAHFHASSKKKAIKDHGGE